MAVMIDLQTVGEKWIVVLDVDPRLTVGYPAPIGSMAIVETVGGVGEWYRKIGSADNAWDYIPTSTLGNIANGVFGRLAIYNAAPNGQTLDDQISQNSQLIGVQIAAQATRSAALQYNIPNPGDAITSADFVLTEGAQAINGNKTFNGKTVFNDDVQINGTVTQINTVNTTITDKLITLNKGGAANTGFGVGFEIEEAATITGYFRTTLDAPTNTGFAFKAPDAQEAIIDFAALTAARTYNSPNESGRILIQDNTTPGVVQQIPYFSTVNKVVSPTGTTTDAFTWDATNKRVGIGTNAPTRTLHVNGASITSGAILQQSANNVSEESIQANVTTTDATVTTLATIAVPNNQSIMVEAKIMGKKTAGAGAGAVNDSVAYVRHIRLQNNGGVVTAGVVQSTFTSEALALVGLSGTIDFSGTNARIRVTGTANSTILWHTTYKVYTV